MPSLFVDPKCQEPKFACVLHRQSVLSYRPRLFCHSQANSSVPIWIHHLGLLDWGEWDFFACRCGSGPLGICDGTQICRERLLQTVRTSDELICKTQDITPHKCQGRWGVVAAQSHRQPEPPVCMPPSEPHSPARNITTSASNRLALGAKS